MTFNNYFFFNFENFSKLFALNCNAAKIAGDLYFLLQYYKIVISLSEQSLSLFLDCFFCHYIQSVTTVTPRPGTGPHPPPARPTGLRTDATVLSVILYFIIVLILYNISEPKYTCVGVEDYLISTTS